MTSSTLSILFMSAGITDLKNNVFTGIASRAVLTVKNLHRDFSISQSNSHINIYHMLLPSQI